jgi:catabolite regulation protein CreA
LFAKNERLLIALLHEPAVFAGGNSLVFGKKVAEGVYVAKAKHLGYLAHSELTHPQKIPCGGVKQMLFVGHG